MIIENNKVISLTYELRLKNENGEVAEKVDSGNPFVFLFGHGNILPKFEENLAGKKVGDAFGFRLSPEEGYGEQTAEAIVDLPMNIFQVEGNPDNDLLKIGNMIPMMDQEGNRLNGKVVKVEAETVTMDFNHPLAGETLFFAGEVLDIREASEEELQHGHVHNHGSHSHGCDDGSCEPHSGCGCGH